MVNAYPKLVAAGGAAEAWKRGPVTFEPPGSMEDLERYVPSKGGGYDAMWDQALAWGASSYHAKSQPIPDAQVAPLERFLKRCGYRFVLRSLHHPRTAARGGPLELHRSRFGSRATGPAPANSERQGDCLWLGFVPGAGGCGGCRGGVRGIQCSRLRRSRCRRRRGRRGAARRLPRPAASVRATARRFESHPGSVTTALGTKLTSLRGRALRLPEKPWTGLYRPLGQERFQPLDLRLIPNFAWANRGRSATSVWTPVVMGTH